MPIESPMDSLFPASEMEYPNSPYFLSLEGSYDRFLATLPRGRRRRFPVCGFTVIPLSYPNSETPLYVDIWAVGGVKKDPYSQTL